MTNGEYLMERLALFLNGTELCPPDRYVVGCGRRVLCYDCWMEWLMREREDARGEGSEDSDADCHTVLRDGSQ